MIKQFKNIVLQTYEVSDLNCDEAVEAFEEKELQKENQKVLIVKKRIKRKGNKLYFK